MRRGAALLSRPLLHFLPDSHTIIRTQLAEISEMERYLKDWYGEGSTRDMAGSMRDMMRGMMGGM